MHKILRYLNIIAAFITVAAIGFLRDAVFVHINFRMSSIYYNSFPYELPAYLSMFTGFDYMSLYYLKYFLTAMSFLLYFLASCWVVYALFGEKKYLKWVLYSYIIVILAGGLLFLFLYWFLGYDNTYLLVRRVVDLAESPVLLLIILTAIFLHKKLPTDKKTAL